MLNLPKNLKSRFSIPNSSKAGAARGSEGITSLVVVFVLVTLLTLIGIGFTKIMNRSLQSSAASQQASAANYAAQSGVNDVLTYLKTQPATAATKCDDLIKTGAPLAAAAKISSDGSTAYTCVLVDPNPTSLFYQSLAPYKAQIVKITTSAQLSSLLFSWQSPNRQHAQFVPAASGQLFYDEKTWSDKNYAPLLRLTLYPVPANGDLSGVQAGSKTFFLYPQDSGSNTLAYGSAGNITPVNCSSKNIGSFSGSADYDCNVVINSLPAAGYYYARFSPYYDQATVKIKGNDGSSQAVQFKSVQSVIDVTAKSGGATKRLQARVDSSAASGAVDPNISSSSDSAPEFAFGSAFAICKRLVVQNPGSLVYIDPPSATNCTQGTQILVEQQKPTVTTTAATSVGTNSATLNGTINPNGISVLTCTFNYGTSSSYGSSQSCSSLPGAGNSPVGVSANVGGLSAGTTYHFQLCATNAANSQDSSTSCGGELTFTTPAPPPTVSISTSPSSINTGQSSTINWSTTGIVTTCTASGDWSGSKPSSGPASTGTLNTAKTYTYTLQCDGPGGSDIRSAQLTVTTPPPPRVTVNVDAHTEGNSGCTTNNGWSCFFWNITTSGTYATISCSNNILSPQENYNIGLAGNNQDGNPGGQTNWQVQCTTYLNGIENGFGIINTPVNTYQAPPPPPPVVNPDPFYCDWVPCVFDPAPSPTPSPAPPPFVCDWWCWFF